MSSVSIYDKPLQKLSNHELSLPITLTLRQACSTHEQQGQIPVGLCLMVCALVLFSCVNKDLSDNSTPHCNVAAITDSFFCDKVLCPNKGLLFWRLTRKWD